MKKNEIDEFRKNAHLLVDWIADYYTEIEKYPVRSQSKPGEVMAELAGEPPQKGESFDDIFTDFKNIILPGLSHWQHPSYFAYFNANTSFPSIWGEMLTSGLGVLPMSWQLSPAGTELEERVMQWLGQILGLPANFKGVIQDTASTATLCSLLSAREKYSDFSINRKGLYKQPVFTVYCSTETHSSIEKAVKIIGLGNENLRKIEVDDAFAMDAEQLEEQIIEDKEKGYVPLAVVSALGTTGSTAVDPLEKIGEICGKYDLWLHVDAAYAGTAMVLPEKRSHLKGIEMADSFVFNPHKWMFTNFDCSAYFVKDESILVRSLEILPEYLKTREGNQVKNYRDWGIQLGRRFRALKLWFVIRSFGVEGIKERVGNHIKWAGELAQWIDESKEFQLLAPVPFATLCFRFKPENIDNPETLNTLNEQLMENLNTTGKIYLSHTKLRGIYTIRFVVGQTNCQKHHVEAAWQLIQKEAAALKAAS